MYTTDHHKSTQGFTLIEVLMVLVIIGIMAAFLIPSFTGYITKQKEKEAKDECRIVVASSQRAYVNQYSKNAPTAQISTAEILSFADVNGTLYSNNIGFDETTLKITALTYQAENGLFVKYNIKKDEKYQITTGSTGYIELEEFIASYQETIQQLVNDGSFANNYPGREEATAQYLKSIGGTLPAVDHSLLESDNLHTLDTPLFWQPYWVSDNKQGIKDSSITVLFATPNNGSNPTNIQNSWNAYLIYVNGKVYESTAQKDGISKPIGISKLSEYSTLEDIDQFLTTQGFVVASH
ncbi:MAG: type II secretion system protein [Lachnospiraceae bacterium]